MTALESNIGNAVEVTLDAQLNSGSGNTTLDMASDPGITAPAYLVLNPDNDSKREVVKWVSGAFGSATIERDKDNKIIEGNPDKIKFVTDRWKFTKNIKNKSPNWYLSEIISQ